MGAWQQRSQAGRHRRCDEIFALWLSALVLICAQVATAILRCAYEKIRWIVKALEGWSDEADRGFDSFNDLTVQRAAMNSLFFIAPYKYEGMWVFDDPAVGLSKEPFIAASI
jgi:hypothetical protein